MTHSRPDPGRDTHFGFKTVDLDAKQGLVDDVFRSVARRYDLMNDLMSGGLHRAWKDALVTAVNPPRGDRPFGLVDVAGGTGDIAFRVVAAGGAGTRVTVCDINPEMLAVGRERAIERGLDDAVSFVDGNAEALPFPDRSFDACTIAFGIRNVPRIDAALAEAYRVLRPGGRFLCLEFSTVDVPGLDTLYDLYSFNVIPALGRSGCRRLPLPGRVDPALSQAAGLRGDDLGRGLPPRQRAAADRRRRGAAFGLALVISAFIHLIRLARAGFVFAREGVLGLVDSAPLPLPARAALACARLIERPSSGDKANRLSVALTALGPTYVKLGQFLATRRDVVGVALARDLESLQDRMAPFPQQQAEATVAAALGCELADVFASFGPPVAAA